MSKQRIKTLSVWQPWASLLVAGVKEYETRGWATKYRGPLAIHAARRWTPDLVELCRRPPYRDLLAELGLSLDELQAQCGHVLGTVDLIGIFPSNRMVGELTELEKRLGDWRPGRYGWRMANQKQFAQPIWATGAQGLWWWDMPKVRVA